MFAPPHLDKEEELELISGGCTAGPQENPIPWALCQFLGGENAGMAEHWWVWCGELLGHLGAVSAAAEHSRVLWLELAEALLK